MSNISKSAVPLVSIIVITYNSAKYVLETLESAKAQTYQNIELLVTDDCSTDDTVEICRTWLMENKKRFLRTELITAEANTGIPGNCNRGLGAAEGIWIKYIAGDDILMPLCIEEFIRATELNHNIGLFTCGMYRMKGEIVAEEIYADPTLLKHNAAEQFKWLAMFLCFIPGPTTFMKREVLYKLNGFDERFRDDEDFPFYIKATANGYFFHLIKSPLVFHRLHDESISQLNGSQFMADFYELYFAHHLLALLKEKGFPLLSRHYLLQKKLFNASSKFIKLMISCWMRLTDPYIWLLKYHKIFHHRAPLQAARQKQITPIHKIELLR